MADIVTALSVGVKIATIAYQGYEAGKQAMALIQKVVDENRDPNEAEWAQLNAVTADLDRQIAAARDELAIPDKPAS